MSYFRDGDNNIICDRTGFKIKRSEAQKEWDGQLVRKESWEARHPQDFPAKPRVPSQVREARSDNRYFLDRSPEVLEEAVTRDEL